MAEAETPPLAALTAAHAARARPAWPVISALAGVAAPVVYTVTVIAGAASIPEYDHVRDSISSLTRSDRQDDFWIQCGFLLYNLLVVLFSFVPLSAPRKIGPWRLVFALYLLTAVSGLLMWPFVEDAPGTMTTTGVTHIALAAIESLSSIAILAISVWQLFRFPPSLLAVVSIVCLVLATVFGFAAATATASNGALMGLFERVTIGAFELWTFSLALSQLGHPASLAASTRKP